MTRGMADATLSPDGDQWLVNVPFACLTGYGRAFMAPMQRFIA
jgi:hypothetical protein